MGNHHRAHIVALVGVAFALVLAGTIPAFGDWGDSTYAVWRDISAAMPGQSPHGDYDTTTQKCRVCHAVHAANPAGQALLHTTVQDACAYCHIVANVSDYVVYGGNVNNYAGTDFESAHNVSVAGGLTGGCVDCHTVHKAYTQMPVNAALRKKILKGSQTSPISNPTYDPFAGAPLSSDSTEAALTKWCTKCHRSVTGGVPYGYYNDYATNEAEFGEGYNIIEYTHIMKDLAVDGNVYDASIRGGSLEPTVVAWGSSKYCSSCHTSNYGDSSHKWPHYTDGARFLVSAGDISAAASPTAPGKTKYDAVCLRCHRDGTRGVGLSW